MSKITIIEGNSNDKDNTRAYMVKGEKGDKGDKGDTGSTGPANTLTIGTVEKGVDASATITGTSPNQTLNLVLPKGDTGSQGPVGFEIPAGSVIGWDSSSEVPEGYEVSSNNTSSILCSDTQPNDVDIFLQHQDNLFAKSTITTGYYVNKSTGEAVSDSVYCYSDYINVDGISTVSVVSDNYPSTPVNPGICFYDGEKTFISGIVVLSSNGSISIPSGAKYMRYSALTSQVDSLKIVKGSTIQQYDKFFAKDTSGEYNEIIINNSGITEMLQPISGVNFFIYKNGKVVTLVARQVTVDNLLNYTLPTGYRPPSVSASLIIYQNTSWQTLLGRIWIAVDGVINISKANSLPATFTDATDGYVTFCFTYLLR